MTAGEFSGYSIFNYDNETFSVDRAYLQYTDDVADDLFFKLRYDVGRDNDTDGDTKLTSYLKNVYVDWKNGDNSKFSLGLISMNSFGVQEKTWGYRFIAKSPVDYHKFISSTADFGIGYSHSFGEFNANVQIVNGDGYKKNDSDGKMLTSLRFMYGESKLNKNDGHNVGIVMTSFDGESDDDTDDYSLTGLFGGWSSSGLRLGLEYNSYDYGDLTDKLTSFYLNYKMSDALNLFARHDMLNTHNDNLSSVDEAVSMLGAVWNPTNGLYISPNITIEDDSNDYRLTFMFKY
tara:strand:+ start:66 stop:935 length:870 start_codon:yes stop_codon:yes gene_type:complete